MGKASSSKKVARAARAGGRVSSGQPRSLLFPSVLTLIVVLGMSLVVYARNDRNNDDLGGRPRIGDHFHTAIGVNFCGTFVGNLPEFAGKFGLHTHGDGLIHVEPVSELATGSNATLSRFLTEAADSGLADLKLDNDSLDYLGVQYEEGKTPCEGVDEPQLRMAYWKDGLDPAAPPLVTTGDFGDRLLGSDSGALTLYYGDSEAEIPQPPTVADLPAVGAETAADASTTTTTAPGDPTTTAPGGTTTTTSSDGATTTTTAAP